MSGKKFSQDQADIIDHKVYKLSEEQTQLLDNIEAQVWYIIKPDLCGFVNKARAEFFGKKKTYFQARLLYDYLSKEEADFAIAENTKVFQTRQKIFTESHQKNKNGEVRLLSIVKMPKLDSEGNVEYIICLGQDITNHKISSISNIKELDSQARIILDSMQDEILLIDLEGNIIETNQKVILLSGKDRSQIIGTNIETILPSKVIDIINLQIKEIIHNKKSIVFDLERGGMDFEVNIHPVINNYHKVDQLVIIFQDISIRKLSEKLLTESKKKKSNALEQANFYKDLFVHDIFNIFNVINMGAELLKSKDSSLDETVDLIKKAITRGSKLIDNIQKLSQLDQEMISSIKIEVKSVLQDVCRFISTSFRDKSIKINIIAPEQKYLVKANNLLYDVFENLLINAIKYNINEEINISIDISRFNEADKKFVKLEFMDNGFGISDEKKKNIFLKINSRRNTTGMGIGLSLVKKIIDNYMGKIWVEDRIYGDPSKGCNFILLIPEYS